MTSPRIWQVPPWQVAILFLATAGLAAAAIYSNMSVPARSIAAVFALMTFGSAVISLRMVLYADDEGLVVRRLVRSTFVPWPDVAQIEVAELKHGQATIRVVRRDGPPVDVPPSLLQPTLPTRTARARAMLTDVASALRTMQNSAI